MKFQWIKLRRGDIAQLSFSGDSYGHSLFIIDVTNHNSLGGISIATHTNDAIGKKISEYNFERIRFIHILNVGI